MAGAPWRRVPGRSLVRHVLVRRGGRLVGARRRADAAAPAAVRERGGGSGSEERGEGGAGVDARSRVQRRLLFRNLRRQLDGAAPSLLALAALAALLALRLVAVDEAQPVDGVPRVPRLCLGRVLQLLRLRLRLRRRRLGGLHLLLPRGAVLGLRLLRVCLRRLHVSGNPRVLEVELGPDAVGGVQDGLGVLVGRGRVDGRARLAPERLGGLAVQVRVLLDVRCGRVVGRVAAGVLLLLPHAHVVDPEGGGPVLSVEGGGPAVPGADRRVHHERHGLGGHLPLGRAQAGRARRAAVANLVLAEGGGLHRPDELVVVVPGDAAVAPRAPLHPVGPVPRVEVVDLGDAARERVRAAGEALRAVRRSVPAVVGLAALAEGELAVPSARPLRGGEAEERGPKVRRHARRELHRANGVRSRAGIRDGALEHVELGGAAALEGEEAVLAQVVVLACGDALRRVGRRQLQVRVALAVRPRPQPRV
mmetsp:Transcript_24396/g.72815  ORF Transcript_24396/g.72815 Transcript_24396/m.72815 type:complete len:478 (+) Transcript_24396:321-1754(+)